MIYILAVCRVDSGIYLLDRLQVSLLVAKGDSVRWFLRKRPKKPRLRGVTCVAQ